MTAVVIEGCFGMQFLSKDGTKGLNGYTRCKLSFFFLTVHSLTAIIKTNKTSISAPKRLVLHTKYVPFTLIFTPLQPFLFNPKNNSFITYDDATSTGIKAIWAMSNGLAGM
jgi:hypothetical protein